MLAAKSAFKLTIAYKVLMAVTGLVLVGFLIAHLAGNLLVFSGSEALNQYSSKLREYPIVLWGARIVLLVSVCLHIFSAIKLTLLNKSARPVAYHKHKSTQATLASRMMFISGCVVLCFILFHLAHLTFRWTHQALFANLAPHDVYSMLILSFKSPWVTGFYTLSILLLMSHLSHGVRSVFQTVGINHSKYNGIIRRVGPVFSVVLGCGFIAIPLSIFFGLIS